MTKEELLELVQSGAVTLELARYELPSERPYMQFTARLTPTQVSAEGFYAAYRKHGAELFILVQLNDSSVCMTPDEHRASWQEAELPEVFGNEQYECCGKCAELRSTMRPRTYNVDVPIGEFQFT